MSSAGALTVTSLGAGDEREWSRFLASSENGTLFHDLDFLAYHPAGRFRFHHLMVRRNGAPVALLPGGLTGPEKSPIFASPLGASVGGPAVAAGFSAADTLSLVAALQDHARARGWAGIELTLAPAAYQEQPSDTLSFALFCRGFQLQHRWLCYMLPLAPGGGAERYKSLFRSRMASFVRAGRRKGITVVEGGEERLGDFLAVFRDTYARHGAAPTHTPEEIADLLRRLPHRVKLHIAMLGDVPVAGVLVLLLNARVAYAFYICMASAYAQERGSLLIFAALLDRLADQGYRWLDLGHGAWDGNFNDGVVFFKEGLGARGYCRDRWSWNTAPGAQVPH